MAEDGVLIRPAELSDIPILAQLESENFADCWAQSTLEDSLNEERYIILLYEDNEPTISIGYILGWFVGDEAEIARVAVSRESRGNGVGENLVRAVLAEFQKRGVVRTFLEVRQNNAAAQRLYEKCGFEEVGRRPNYYSDGQTAIVMRRE